MTKAFKPTSRTTVRRLPERGVYDLDEIHRILDEAFICHVGFTVEEQPYVIPTAFGCIGDTFYLHGSAASRMLRAVGAGIRVCVTVTLVDGLVLARSAFHHSINYRSVVLLGEAEFVTGPEEKVNALRAITEHIVPGRWDGVRWPSDLEVKATSVLSIPISEASAKVRTGPPKDDEEDYGLPIWAGVLPLAMMPGSPSADPRLLSGVTLPDYVRDYSRESKGAS
ncbi:MAG: pyridoxamine 5'-phosphate oxidase family protein [Acidobacteriota bacterium]